MSNSVAAKYSRISIRATYPINKRSLWVFQQSQNNINVLYKYLCIAVYVKSAVCGGILTWRATQPIRGGRSRSVTSEMQREIALRGVAAIYVNNAAFVDHPVSA